MDQWPPFVPYLILAVICASASSAIGIGTMAFVFSRGSIVSDTGMLAIAGMAFAPAVLGIGIAAFMPRDRH
jgi:hypothetical protein